MPDEELIERFLRESAAVGANTFRATNDALAGTVAGLLQGDRSVVASAGLERIVAELQRRGVRVVSEAETGRAAEVLSEVDAGIGLALAGIACSGTVLMGPGSGLEGLISTLPPHCVVLLPADAIQLDLAAALDTAAPLIAHPGSRLAFVTGPSRTSDIELTPIIGVHGPLRLNIVIVDG